MRRTRSKINFYNKILTYKLSFLLLLISSIQLTANNVKISGSTREYTHHSLLSAPFYTIPVLAVNFTIPDSWQVLATAQDGEISQFSIRGDWLAWIKRQLDPQTAGNRAESFFVGLYRKRLDSNEIETLRAPDFSNTWGEHFVLGDNGIVSYDYRGAYVTLYLPGQQPFTLYKGDSYAGKDTPIKIYRDAMFCVSKKRVSLIPFASKLPDLKRRIRLDLLKEYDDLGTDLFLGNKHILYTQKKSERIPTTRKYPKSISKTEINLFDIESRKTIWRDERISPEIIQALGLNNKYIYYYVKCQTFKLNSEEKIFRRSLNDLGKAEQIIMPFHVPFLIDFSSERLLCIITVITKQDKYRLKCYVAEIDFQKGLIETFDIPLFSIINGPALDSLKLPNVVYVEKEPLGEYKQIILYITGDAEFSRIIVVFNNKIYLVPKIKTEELAGSGWHPTDKENEK